MNHKKLYRLYREEGLAVRRRRGRKRATGTRAPTAVPQARTSAGRSTSSPTAVLPAGASGSWSSSTTSRASAWPRSPTRSISGQRVARELDALIVARRGRPAMIVSDNGTELTSRAVLAGPTGPASTGTTSRPASRSQNAFVESFIGRLRDECLNEEVFATLARPAT